VSEDPDGDTQTFSLAVRFPGQYEDAETGRHYNMFRTYDPATGRYLEPDPLGPAGSLNPYPYVENSPQNYIDPEALFLSTVDAYCTRHPYACAALGGAFGGAATTAVLDYATEGCVDPTAVAEGAAVGALLGPAGPLLRSLGAARRAAQLGARATTRSGIGVTSHGGDQKITRSVRTIDELDAIRNPLQRRPIRIDELGRPSERVIGRRAEVVSNPETGEIVSVNPTSTKKVERLLRRAGLQP
jgi:RHS repeat-associated protein